MQILETTGLFLTLLCAFGLIAPQVARYYELKGKNEGLKLAKRALKEANKSIK